MSEVPEVLPPDWPNAPAEATHAWLDHDGSFLHWMKVENGLHFFYRGGIWPVIAADLLHTRGTVVARP